jgi:hypothetical protein
VQVIRYGIVYPDGTSISLNGMTGYDTKNKLQLLHAAELRGYVMGCDPVDIQYNTLLYNRLKSWS